jgi:hypothetical protein
MTELAIRKLRPVGAALILLFATSAVAQAQFPGDVPDTFRLRLGGMYAWFNTEVTFQENITEGGPIGAGVSLEDVLGLPGSRAGFAAKGYWNFAGRFFVDFGYTGFSRSREESIARDFNFGDVTYTVGASVEASMKSHLPYLDFRYGIVKNDAVQFGVSLGAAYPNLEANASASAGVVGPGGPIIGQTVTRTAKVSMPVPLLGLQFESRLGDGLSAGVIFNGIFAPVSPYTGSILDAEAHIDWFATRNFGVGAAFSYTRFDVKREEANTYVEFKYSYYGPRLYALVTF